MGATHIWRDGEMVEYVEFPPRAGRLQYNIITTVVAPLRPKPLQKTWTLSIRVQVHAAVSSLSVAICMVSHRVQLGCCSTRLIVSIELGQRLKPHRSICRGEQW